MPVERDLPKYFQSFSKELNISKDRIRNIIGDRHWVTDGMHKEVILQEIIRKFLPEKYNIGTGFIVSDDGSKCSNQIDILIYENTSPFFYHSSNFVIIPRQYVKAIIEVKTNISKSDTFKDALNNLLTAQKIVQANCADVYTGIFSYDYNPINTENVFAVSNRIYRTISDFYQTNLAGEDEMKFLRRYTLTTLCINGHIYGLHWNTRTETEPKFGIYYTKEDSFNFFVSNLLNTIDNTLINNTSSLWYPTEKKTRRILFESLLMS